MDSIGLILKEERLRLGMSQDEFAIAGGVKRRAQQNYEQDERSPDALYLRKLAAIGVDVQYVLTGQPSVSLLAPEENELLSGFRKLDLRGKVSLLGMVDVVGKTTPVESKTEKQSPFANTIKGKKAQVNQGVNHGTISSGKIVNKIGGKKKDDL